MSRTAQKPPTLRQYAYERIRGKILSGLLPVGCRLAEEEIAREIGVSRTPMREAISQLASEGLVEQRPRGGAFVKLPDPRELGELYEVREALETFAAARAAELITPAQLGVLQKNMDDMRNLIRDFQASGKATLAPAQATKFRDLDAAFHCTLINAAGNSRLEKTVTELQLMSRIFGHAGHRETDLSLGKMARVLVGHRRVLRALQQRDAAAAAHCIAQTIRHGRRVALARWGQREAAAASAKE